MGMRSLVAALFAGVLPAQLLVVDPLGTGTYTDLQTAINAAPAGAVIQVIGGSYGPLVINRSVTVVGQNTPHIRSPITGLGTQPPAITMVGTGSETVVLAGLDISGTCNGASWNYAGPGILGSGLRRLAIHDCSVRGHTWFALTGSADGASAIVLGGATTLQIERSVVTASRSFPGAYDQWAPNGAPAIAAAAATVVVLDSTVTGGDADTSTFSFGPPGPTPCPCGALGQEPGRGGIGVRAQVVYTAGSVIHGGQGSPVFVAPPTVPALTQWGHQPAGIQVQSNVTTTFASALTSTTPLRLGAVHTLTFASTTAPSLLLVGSPPTWPVTTPLSQFVFVDLGQPFVMLFLPVASTAYSLTVPATTGLIGFELAEQRFDLVGGVFYGTNPVFSVVAP